MESPAPVSAETIAADFLAGYLASVNTYDAYRRDLGDYFRHCSITGVDPVGAERVEVAEYLAELARKGRSPATVARRLVVLRGFYAHAVEEFGLSASPAVRLKLSRHRGQVRIPALSEVELRSFLQHADWLAGTPPSVRTRGLAWLLATTGIRISEACNAQIEDIAASGSERWLTVTCKGSIQRSVPIHDAAWARLEDLCAGPAGPIFATSSGRPVDRGSAARALNDLALRAGIRIRFSPHVLRHTFVTLARAAGCPLEDVQEAAGHADPATTRAYDRTLRTHAHHPGHRILTLLAAPPLHPTTQSARVGLDGRGVA